MKNVNTSDTTDRNKSNKGRHNIQCPSCCARSSTAESKVLPVENISKKLHYSGKHVCNHRPHLGAVRCDTPTRERDDMVDLMWILVTTIHLQAVVATMMQHTSPCVLPSMIPVPFHDSRGRASMPQATGPAACDDTTSAQVQDATHRGQKSQP